MAEVVGTYYAHGTHTQFAAVLRDVVLKTTDTTYTIEITTYCHHYNNDATANKISAVDSTHGFTVSVTNTGGGIVSDDIAYPTLEIPIGAGEGTIVDGDDLIFTITGNRTTAPQTISDITVRFQSRIGDKNTSTATWPSSIIVPSTQSYSLMLYKRGADISNSYITETGYYDSTPKTIPTMTTLGWKEPGTFLGWATSAANAVAGTVTYTDGASVSLTSDIPLYAVWKYPTRVKVNGNWEGVAAYVKVNGTWQVATGVYCKVNGIWKQLGT